MDRPLWVPSADRVQRANLTRFRRFVHERAGVEATRYGRLHDWSVNKPVGVLAGGLGFQRHLCRHTRRSGRG